MFGRLRKTAPPVGRSVKEEVQYEAQITRIRHPLHLFLQVNILGFLDPSLFGRDVQSPFTAVVDCHVVPRQRAGREEKDPCNGS